MWRHFQGIDMAVSMLPWNSVSCNSDIPGDYQADKNNNNHALEIEDECSLLI